MRKTFPIKTLLALALVLISGTVWADSWQKASIDDLSANDVFVIVATADGTDYALDGSGGTSASPSAIPVTVENDIITSNVTDNIRWTVEFYDNKYYVFHSNGEQNKWLYCTNSNTGVRVGTNANKYFSISDEGYFVEKETTRYLGVYTSKPDWRCYTSINNNIKDQTFAFYKLTSDPGDQSVATVITIDDSGLTNTDVHAGTAAGVLKAVVKAGDAVLENAAVTWTSSKTDVATIDAQGAVTLVAAGTTTITASYAGVDGQYKPSTRTYDLTVIDSNAPGSTADNPYTVAQARAAIDANTGVKGVYATGIVSAIVTEFSSTYGNISYNISEDGSTTADQLQAYRGMDKDGEKFTSADDVQVGDVVVIYGDLTKYGETYEFAAGNQRVSFVRQQAAVEKPTFDPEGGDYEEEVTVRIACATQGATIYYTIDGTEPTNQSTPYTTALTITQTTTVKAIAYKDNDKSAVATATYTLPVEAPFTSIADLQAAVTANEQPVKVTFNNWVVTAVKSSNAYVSDGEKGFLIYQSNHGLKAGDKLSGTVECKLVLYKGQTELKDFTTLPTATAGEAPAPREVAIADIKVENQSSLVKVAGVTYNGTEKTLTDGTNTIAFYDSFNAGVTLTDGVKYDVTGVVIYFNGTTLQLCPRTADDVVEKADQTPAITVAESTIAVSAEGAEKEIDVTFKNLDGANAVVKHVDANGTVLPNEYDWIAADVENGKLVVIVGANTGDARTGYLTVSVGDVTSAIVTVSQEKNALAADYAELPFSWAGGASADLLATNGVSAEGLGEKDYGDTHAPYHVKFDTTGDFIQVKTDQRPGVVTVGVKMVGGANDSKITVQGSADGVDFTDVEELTISGTQNTILELSTVKTFAENDRFVRLVFTKGSNVGVGPISISTYVEPTPNPVKFNAGENVEMFVFDAANQNTPLEDGALVMPGTTVLVSATATSDDYEIDAVTVTDADNNAVAVSKGDDEASWTFVMPASNVTISVTAKVKEVETLYTLATAIELGKHYIIVGKKDNSVYAMGEQRNNNRGAVAVNIADAGVMVAPNAGVYEFVIKGCEAGYVIYDESEASTGFLYAAGSGSNYLKTTATPFDNGKWSIYIDDESGVATIAAQGANTNNTMRFNSGSSLFSCYLPENNQQDVYLYVKDGDTGSETETFYKSIEYEFATVCLPFNATVPKGVKAYMATEYSASAVTLTELPGNIIPAQKGVVVVSENKVFAPFVQTSENGRIPEDNLLEGVTDYTEFVEYEDYNQYALQEVNGKAAFCLVEGGAYAANTAYLLLPKGQSNTLTIRFGDATRIANAMAEAENAQVYDLSGRAVDGILTKGLYIVNGKKIVVK